MKSSALLAWLSLAALIGGASLSACASRSPDHGEAAQGAASPGAAAGDLKTIMVDLGRQMHALHDGLWIEDLAAVGVAATAVAEHPRVSPEERTRVQQALGEDFPRFVKMDHQVHDTAVEVAKAAAAGDLDATVRHLGTLEASCVSCHTQFRARLLR